MLRFARVLAPALFGATSLAAAAHSIAAQASPRQRTISRMEVEYPDPFTCVRWGSVRELADGRLIVADPSEKRLELIDLRRGSGTKIGREGSGPGEWAVPMALVPLAGDTTLLYDPQNTRMLKILPNGSVAEDPISLGTSGSRGMMILAGPRGYDRMGRLYSQGQNVIFTPDGPPTPTDSAPITRFDPRAAKTDTIAFIAMPRPNIQTSGTPGGRGMQVMMQMSPNPFAPQPTWAVLPDGRVGIVTPEPYRVQWIGANRARTDGPVTPYERVRVTDADRTTRPRAPSCNISISMNRGGGAAEMTVRASAAAAVGGGRSGAPPARDDWPEFKPPFVGTQSAVATPTGEIWVQRARPANDDVVSYDVFDDRGTLTSRVVLPKGGRLLGFGNGTVYLSRMDDDDLVYIQRWRLDSP